MNTLFSREETGRGKMRSFGDEGYFATSSVSAGTCGSLRRFAIFASATRASVFIWRISLPRCFYCDFANTETTAAIVSTDKFLQSVAATPGEAKTAA